MRTFERADAHLIEALEPGDDVTCDWGSRVDPEAETHPASTWWICNQCAHREAYCDRHVAAIVSFATIRGMAFACQNCHAIVPSPAWYFLFRLERIGGSC